MSHNNFPMSDNELAHLCRSLTGLVTAVTTAISSWSMGGVATKQDLKEMEARIMATAQETLDKLSKAQADITATKTSLNKISQESTDNITNVKTLTQKVADLEAVIAAGGDNIPQNVQDAVDAVSAAAADVKTSAQAVDDLTPDVPAPQP